MRRLSLVAFAAFALSACQDHHASDQAKIKDLETRLAAAEERASSAEALSRQVLASPPGEDRRATFDRERALMLADRAATAQEQQARAAEYAASSAAYAASVARSEALRH